MNKRIFQMNAKVPAVITALGLFVIALFIPLPLFAGGLGPFQFQVPIPGVPNSLQLCNESACDGFATYMTQIYMVAIKIALVLAFVMIFAGGFLWMAGAAAKAKKMIANASIGMALALCSFAILWLINPNLVHMPTLTIFQIEKIAFELDFKEDDAPGSGTSGECLPTFSHFKVEGAAKTDLTKGGVVTQILVDLMHDIDAQGFNVSTNTIKSNHDAGTFHNYTTAIPGRAVDIHGSIPELTRLATYLHDNQARLEVNELYYSHNTDAGVDACHTVAAPYPKPGTKLYNDHLNHIHVAVGCSHGKTANSNDYPTNGGIPDSGGVCADEGGAGGGSTNPSLACGKGTSIYTGTSDGSGTWNASKTVWVPNVFKTGDKPDVLYYFHGIIGTGGSCTGTSDTRATMVEGGEAFTAIQNLIKTKKINPLVIVVPQGVQKTTSGKFSGLDNTIAGARAEAHTFLTTKGITAFASESIAGHSNGGEPVASAMAGNFKYIGLIDPWMTHLTPDKITAQKPHIIYSFNPTNWPGNADKDKKQREALETIGTQIGTPKSSTAHCAMVAEQMGLLPQCFAPNIALAGVSPNGDPDDTEGGGIGGASSESCPAPRAQAPQKSPLLAMSYELRSFIGISPVDAATDHKICTLPQIPLFNQKDYDIPYGITGTIATSGCGPTAAAMVMSYYKKRGGSSDQIMPPEVAEVFTQEGYRGCDKGCTNHEICCHGTRPEAFTKPKSIGVFGFVGTEIAHTENSIKSYIKNKIPIIISIGPNVFTKKGHYIVLTGIDQTQGTILLNDSFTDDGQPGQRCYNLDSKVYCGQIPESYLFSNKVSIRRAFYVRPNTVVSYLPSDIGEENPGVGGDEEEDSSVCIMPSASRDFPFLTPVYAAACNAYQSILSELQGSGYNTAIYANLGFPPPTKIRKIIQTSLEGKKYLRDYNRVKSAIEDASRATGVDQGIIGMWMWHESKFNSFMSNCNGDYRVNRPCSGWNSGYTWQVGLGIHTEDRNHLKEAIQGMYHSLSSSTIKSIGDGVIASSGNTNGDHAKITIVSSFPSTTIDDIISKADGGNKEYQQYAVTLMKDPKIGAYLVGAHMKDEMKIAKNRGKTFADHMNGWPHSGGDDKSYKPLIISNFITGYFNLKKSST